MQSKQLEKQRQQDEHGAVADYECSKCQDTEFITYYEKSTNGLDYEFAKPCDCRDRKAWKRRFKNAYIPDEFTNANFDNFERKAPVQVKMYQMTRDYLKQFQIKQNEDGSKEKVIPSNNFGLIAVFGEQRLKELPLAERSEVKQRHNNFGIGKTHLQIALAKKLIKEGLNVLIVSDVTFMEELMNSKKMSDEGETYNKLLHNSLNADVLVWDDIGKVNWTEARERMYYAIINERYRRQKPIIFNSNEDRGTLAEKIGYAAASRLLGQAEGFLIEAEGQDWRLKRGAQSNV